MRKSVIVILLILIAFTAIPVVAQDVTPQPTIPFEVEPTSEPEVVNVTTETDGGINVTAPGETGNYPIIDPAAIVATIVNAVSGLVMAAFGAAPVTVVIVALLKRIPALDEITAPTMTFATAAILYIGAIVASVTGFTPQFESFLDMIATVAPVLVSFIGTLIGAPAIHRLARANNVAFIGASRTPPQTFVVTDGKSIRAVGVDLPEAQVN